MRTRLLTRLLPGAGAAAALAVAGLVAALPAQAHTTAHTAMLSSLNGSGVTGQVTVLQQHGQVRVDLTVKGLEAGQVHLQHIHGFTDSDQQGSCPTPDLDTDGDGLVSFAEGLPAYGPAVITLGADETPGQTLSYSRTYTETNDGQPVSSLGALDDYTIVVHGLTVNGAYDRTLPVACAVLDINGS